jgi:hypothetical protein
MRNRSVTMVFRSAICGLALCFLVVPSVISAQSALPLKRPLVPPQSAAPPVISPGTPAPLPTGVISVAPPTPILRPIAPPRPGVVTVVAKSKVTVAGNLPNGVQAVGYQALRAPVGLASFKMSFTQPNRHLWRLSVAPETETAGLLGMYDGEPGMAPIPVDYRATWIRIPGAVSGVVSTTTPCFNCNLSVPPGPPNSALVLSGFDLRLRGPARFSHLSLMARSDTLDGVSRGVFDVEIISEPEDEFEAITIYYAWVPFSTVATHTILNTDDPETLKGGDQGGDVVLRGFKIGYYDGVARRFQALGIHVDGSEPPTRSGSAYVTLSGEGLTPEPSNIGPPIIKYKVSTFTLR